MNNTNENPSSIENGFLFEKFELNGTNKMFLETEDFLIFTNNILIRCESR